jgi:hypothetical protein
MYSIPSHCPMAIHSGHSRTSVTEELYRTFYGDAAAKIAAWLETAAA